MYKIKHHLNLYTFHKKEHSSKKRTLKSNFPYTQGSVRKFIPPHVLSWPSEVTEGNHQRLFKNKGTYCSLYGHAYVSLQCLNNKNTTYPELFILCFKHHKIISFPKLTLTFLKVSDNGILIQLLCSEHYFYLQNTTVSRLDSVSIFMWNLSVGPPSLHIGTSPINWAQLSTFHLKETESTL
jgi:hypothetical protein